MKSRVLRIGLVVLVGSLALNVTIVFEPFVNNSVKENIVKKDSVQEQIATHLVNKGVEPISVQKLIGLEHNIDENSVKKLSSILEVPYSKVIENISNKILQKKRVDLNSVNTLISIAQSIKGGYIASESIEELHKLSMVV